MYRKFVIAGLSILFAGMTVWSQPHWEFDTPGDLEGWTAENHIFTFGVLGGYLHAHITGTDPYMYSPDNLGFSGTSYTRVLVRMKSTGGSDAQLFFATTSDGTWSEAKSKHCPIHQHSYYVTYIFDFGDNTSWTGHTIKRLRLDPNADASGSDVYIDFIGVYSPWPSKKWIGPEGGSWKNADYWSPEGVPSSSDHVTITSPGPLIPDDGCECSHIMIGFEDYLGGELGSMTSASGSRLYVHGNWHDNYGGTFQPSQGDIAFVGSPGKTITQKSSNYFHNLYIDCPGYTTSLTSDIQIHNNLYPNGGTFNVSGHTTTVDGKMLLNSDDGNDGVLQIGTGTLKVTGDIDLQSGGGGTLSQTSGNIWVGGTWFDDNETDCQITGGNVYFKWGGGVNVVMSSDDHFYNLYIDKDPGGIVRSWGTTLTADYWLHIDGGTFLIAGGNTVNTPGMYVTDGGILKMTGGTLNVNGSSNQLSFNNGSSEDISGGKIVCSNNSYIDFYAGCNFTPTGGEVQLIGNNTAVYYSGGTVDFYDLTIGDGSTVTSCRAFNDDGWSLSHNLTVKNDATFDLDEKTLKLGDGALVDVQTGGKFKALGSSNKVTHNGFGYYNFTVNGELNAKSATFEYMGTDGINITSSGTINTSSKLDSCTFRYGNTDGTLLTIDNNQVIDNIQGTKFPSAKFRTAQYNVTKNLNQGHITFNNWTGDFGGENYENDPDSRIDWIPSAGIEETYSKCPEVSKLHQNYPNPFSLMTNIKYQVPKKTPVILRIYDITGKLVKTIVDSEHKPGYYTVRWNGRDSNGKRVANGIYFCTAKIGDYTSQKKIIALTIM